MDMDPNQTALNLNDLRIGTIARGTGTKGQKSRVHIVRAQRWMEPTGANRYSTKNDHISLTTFWGGEAVANRLMWTVLLPGRVSMLPLRGCVLKSLSYWMVDS